MSDDGGPQVREKDMRYRKKKSCVCVGIRSTTSGTVPSHALEHSITQNIPHESISLLFMEELNRQFDDNSTWRSRSSGATTKEIPASADLFPAGYGPVDYLRGQLYTGVSEGRINAERLLTMLNVVGDELVVDAKGIYQLRNLSSPAV